MKRCVFLFILFSFAIVSCDNKVKIRENMTTDELEKTYQEMINDLFSQNNSIHTFVIDLAVSNVMKQMDWLSAIELLEIHHRQSGLLLSPSYGSYFFELADYKNWHYIYVYEYFINYGSDGIFKYYLFVEQKLPPLIVKSKGSNVVPPYNSFIISNDKGFFLMCNYQVIMNNESVYNLNNGSNMVEFYHLYGEELSRQLQIAKEQNNMLSWHKNNKFVKKWIN